MLSPCTSRTKHSPNGNTFARLICAFAVKPLHVQASSRMYGNDLPSVPVENWATATAGFGICTIVNELLICCKEHRVEQRE
jgi:hypothetical protein